MGKHKAYEVTDMHSKATVVRFGIEDRDGKSVMTWKPTSSDGQVHVTTSPLRAHEKIASLLSEFLTNERVK